MHKSKRRLSPDRLHQSPGMGEDAIAAARNAAEPEDGGHGGHGPVVKTTRRQGSAGSRGAPAEPPYASCSHSGSCSPARTGGPSEGDEKGWGVQGAAAPKTSP